MWTAAIQSWTYRTKSDSQIAAQSGLLVEFVARLCTVPGMRRASATRFGTTGRGRQPVDRENEEAAVVTSRMSQILSL
ncbi:MAG: hypothetical protein JWN34_2897 [Bryobacterales bacterium]|nr:hypothetical protein [Bryobacterales bacterium]